MEEQAIHLKITLKGSKPPIWRRLLVKSSMTLFELHHSIQIAMGWENYHLYEFTVDNYRIGQPHEDFDDEVGIPKVIDAKDITLDKILPSTKKISYEYDFGDGWKHEIILEKTLPIDENLQYPLCIDGKMNCPPEDCGGIVVFCNLTDIIKNPKHPKYLEVKEWLGESYDPSKFDQMGINFALGKIQERIDEEEEDISYQKKEFGWDEWDDEEEDDDEDYFAMYPDLSIKIVNKSKHGLPEYESEGSAGMDLRANIEKSIVLKPLERTLVKTGLFIELPLDFEVQIRPRSGLALKHGITVLNSPGTIDADYRGEIGVVLVNLSNETYTVKDGDRIAQMVIARHERVEWELVKKLGDTHRGEGGFGSTGFQ